MHVELRFEKAGETLRDHHFFVTEEREIAEYARNAIARFYEDNLGISLLDPDITLKFAKGSIPNT